METENRKANPKLKKTLVFLIRLLLLSLPLYLIIFFGLDMLPFQAAVSGQASFIMDALNISYQREGTLFILDSRERFSFMITEDCTGWKPMLFLFALVFAVPGIRIKRRLLGLATGLPIIYVGNLARIIILVLIQASLGTSAAMFVHTYLWQLGMIGLVLLVWVLWMRCMGKGGAGKDQRRLLEHANQNIKI